MVKGERENRLTSKQFVLAFGVVSMLADFVYEGARGIVGPCRISVSARRDETRNRGPAGTVGTDMAWPATHDDREQAPAVRPTGPRG